MSNIVSLWRRRSAPSSFSRAWASPLHRSPGWSQTLSRPFVLNITQGIISVAKYHRKDPSSAKKNCRLQPSLQFKDTPLENLQILANPDQQNGKIQIASKWKLTRDLVVWHVDVHGPGGSVGLGGRSRPVGYIFYSSGLNLNIISQFHLANGVPNL